MLKKVISIVLCIIMVLSFSACSVKFWKNSGTSDTEKLDKYEKGFFTKDAYYNESCGLKFNCPKEEDYKFESVKDNNDFTTPLSDAETEIEAICRTGGSVVAFFSVNKVGITKNMDDAVDELLEEINKNKGALTKYELEEISGQEKGENVTLAKKEYRQIVIKTKQLGQDLKINLYLRIVGNTMFVIETANAEKIVKDIDLDKYIEELDEKEDLDKLKEEAKSCEEELDKKEEEAKNDPAVDTNATYVKGTKTAKNGYTNTSAKIKYDLPKDVSVASLAIGTEYCVNSKADSLCIMTITSESISSVSNINQVIDGFKKGLELSTKSAKVISSDKHETLAGQTWRFIESEIVSKEGKTELVKTYMRIIGNKAMAISFRFEQGKEKAYENVKSGLSELK